MEALRRPARQGAPTVFRNTTGSTTSPMSWERRPHRLFRELAAVRSDASTTSGKARPPAFSTAAIQGLATRAAFEPALKLALAAAVAFYVLGWFCGEMARRIVEESVPLAANSPAPPNAPHPTATSAPQTSGR